MKKTNTSNPGVGGARAAQALLAAIMLAGTFAVFAPALSGEFIWDDDVHFTSNRAVATRSGIIDIWTSRKAMYYPLTLTTGWFIHKAFGFNPLAFHVVTLLFHVGSALVLVNVLKRLRIPGAWVAGFLFAWHPMQVESAAWICELKNTQSAFFMLLAVAAIERSGFFQRPFPGTRQEKWMLRVSVAFFVLAVLSKTSVVTLPVVLAALAWWTRGVRRWMDIDGLFPFFLVSILASGWTIWEQRYSSGAFDFEWSLSFAERLVLSGQIAWFYLLKLLWPSPVMFIYPKWEIDTSAVLSWLPVASLAALAVVFFLKRRTWGRLPGLVLFLYGVLIFPLTGFFNVYFMRYAWVADHFVYLAAIPVFAVIGAAAARFIRLHRTAGLAACMLVTGSCAWLSFSHARTFTDAETLWRDTLEKNPGAWMAYNNLGLLHLERGEHDEAKELFEQALEHNPEHYEAMNNLGTLYQRTGRNAEALSYFDAALELRPELYHSWINRGNVLKDSGDIEAAFASFDRAAELRPDEEAAWVNIANLAEAEGRGEKACRAYHVLLAGKGLGEEQIGGFLYERAYVLARQDRPELALYFLDRAAQLAPGLADIYLLEGILHERLAEYGHAEKSYRYALHLRPDWGAVLIRLARLLAASPDPEQRRPREALEMTDAMINAGGDRVPDILDVHAIVLAANGRFADAAHAQSRAVELATDQAQRRDFTKRLPLFQAGQAYYLKPPSASAEAAADKSTNNHPPSPRLRRTSQPSTINH